jgi:hypothetical protein
MFITDTFIDSFQKSKKQAVAALITDKKLAETFNGIIDTQATYTKQFVNTMTDTSKAMGVALAQVSEDMIKFKAFKPYPVTKK